MAQYHIEVVRFVVIMGIVSDLMQQKHSKISFLLKESVYRSEITNKVGVSPASVSQIQKKTGQ